MIHLAITFSYIVVRGEDIRSKISLFEHYFRVVIVHLRYFQKSFTESYPSKVTHRS